MEHITGKQLQKFTEYLRKANALFIESNNEWELLRFKVNGQIGVVYQNKFGYNKFTGIAHEIYQAFKGKKSAQNIRINNKYTYVIKTIQERDGEDCFYCAKPIETDLTIEHLLSASHGGNNNINNLVLVHQQCNIEAGNLSVASKVKLREKLRSLK